MADARRAPASQGGPQALAAGAGSDAQQAGSAAAPAIGPEPSPGVAAPAPQLPPVPMGTKLEAPPGCCLFVYHIPTSWADEDLATSFAPLAPPGNLLSATVFKDKATGLSKGFGFVNYDNQASAQNAIAAMNGMQVDGKRLKVEVKKPKGATAPAPLPHGGVLLTAPAALSQQDPAMAMTMQQMAMHWGIPAQAGVNPDGTNAALHGNLQMQQTAQSPGQQGYDYSQYAHQYGNAVYQDPSLGYAHMDPTMAGYAAGWPPNVSAAPGAWPGQVVPMGMHMPGIDAGVMAAYGMQAMPAPQIAPSKPKVQPPPNCTLFIYHLPVTWTDNDLEQCFQPFAAPGQLLHALVYKDKATGASKGFGFVSYDNPQSAQTAIAGMNGMSIDSGKRLRVELKRPKGERFTPYS